MARARRNSDAVGQLLELAAARGQLVAIGPDYWLHAAVEEQARHKVAAALAERGHLTVSEIRGLLGRRASMRCRSASIGTRLDSLSGAAISAC